MKTADQYRFKNLPSKRFHDFFVQKISSGEISNDHFFSHYGIKPGSNNYLLYSLRNAKASVTIDQIEIAKEKYGLNPAWVFGVAQDDLMDDDGPDTYTLADMDIKTHIGNVTSTILKRHKVVLKDYAEKRLGITPQALHKILRGDQRMFMDTGITICEDFGESLNQYRRGPVKK